MWKWVTKVSCRVLAQMWRQWAEGIQKQRCQMGYPLAASPRVSPCCCRPVEQEGGTGLLTSYAISPVLFQTGNSIVLSCFLFTLEYKNTVVYVGSTYICQLVRWVPNYEVPWLDLIGRESAGPREPGLGAGYKNRTQFWVVYDQRGSDLIFECMWHRSIMLGRDTEIVRMERRVYR